MSAPPDPPKASTKPQPKAQPKPQPKPQKNRRRRGRELALQALFTLDHAQADKDRGANAVAAALYRIRERALSAELECVAGEGDRDEATTVAQALLQLDKAHPLALEIEAWLAGKAPTPLAPSADEKGELEAVRGSTEELDFCDQIVRGVFQHKDAIDKLLQDSSTNWRVGRMVGSSRVDLQACKLEYSIVSPK